MKLKLLFAALMTMTLSFAQKKQVDKIIDNSKDGVSTVYNDSKEAVSTVYNDVKSMSPKVEEAVKSLAEQFKTTTNALWNILVKQQLVWSICFLILTLTSIFNWWLFYKRNLQIKLTKDDFVTGQRDIIGEIPNPNYNRYGDSDSQMINGPVGKEEILLLISNPNNNWFKYLHLFICITLSVFSFYHFSDMLTGFFNPEYGALQTIMKVATKL
ncbi:MAG: hypothetical protein WA079_01470 [Leuconostoc falkenbergense]|uniref:hypothetical protein n=1 Tax=Leuconostoc falkenbergense TaxID=2766470 RepID=UPI003BB7A698